MKHMRQFRHLKLAVDRFNGAIPYISRLIALTDTCTLSSD